MIFSNPYFVILLLMMGMSLVYANFMDGQPMPDRKYNFTTTMIGTLIQFGLIFGAVMWAASH